ncbi:hypothetical protein BOTBODRAFT_57738 [Botryobasidium botryosum FD-172 SS1]|uniref:Uncharacterized protein n=1 Tax=Botryobasidium botryosum (strain FD-172 SS1) TaxID=930990 RepID=A0A067M8H3_BOTB1|nr:hypothetical protein BOTBODRAFT_57738 [Botryobasidium botryosum FD-172 SS1]
MEFPTPAIAQYPSQSQSQTSDQSQGQGYHTPGAEPPSYVQAALAGYTDNDARLLFAPPLLSPSAPVRPIQIPVCVPQLAPGVESPFSRAYSPVLAAAGIDQAEWLKFTDGLNIAFSASPPLRVVNTAGKIIGFVPYHWAIIAGAAMQTAAQTGMHVLSKGLTDRYLRHANDTFFAPRGLRVRLCTTAAMRQLIGLDARTPPNKTLDVAKSIGRGVETVGLHLPIIRKIIVRLHPAPRVDERTGRDATARRVAALGGAIAPLDYNVPPPRTPEGLMDKSSALCIKLDQWSQGRAQAKASRARELLEIRRGGGDVTGMGEQFGAAGRRARRADRRAARDQRRGRVPTPSRAMMMRVAIADRIEANQSIGVLWIVVIDASQDDQIENREIVDSKDDKELIPESEWEDQLELEDEVDQKQWDELEKHGEKMHFD